MELRSGELRPLKVKWGSLSPGDSRTEVFSILCLRRDSHGIQWAPNRCHSLPSSTSSPASSHGRVWCFQRLTVFLRSSPY